MKFDAATLCHLAFWRHGRQPLSPEVSRQTGEKDDLFVISARLRMFHDATVLGKITDLVVRHASVPMLIIQRFPNNGS